MNLLSLCTNPKRSNKSRLNINHSESFVINSEQAEEKYQENHHTFETQQYLITFKDFKTNLTGEALIKKKSTGKTIYQGMIMHGKRCGFGIQFNEMQEQVYRGEFFDNERCGWGQTSTYKGEFKNNKYSGYGRYLCQDQFYVGSFLEGYFQGMGVYLKCKEDEFKDKNFLEQQEMIDSWVLNALQKNPSKLFGNKQGEMNIEEVYIGHWISDQKHGSGKLWKEMGEYWYSGQFSFGIYHGNGALHQPKKQLKKGSFIKGKYCG